MTSDLWKCHIHTTKPAPGALQENICTIYMYVWIYRAVLRMRKVFLRKECPTSIRPYKTQPQQHSR